MPPAPAPAVAAATPSTTPAPVQHKPVAPQAPATPKPEAPAAPEQTFELKVKGETRRLTLAQLQREAQKGLFTGDLMRQAKEAITATQKKQAELAERESLWDDDAKLEAELERRGKLDALARRRLEKKVGEAQMTPEQREAFEHRTRAEAAESKLKDIERQQAEAATAQRYEQAAKQSENELMAASERLNFERNPETFYALHSVLKEWVELGVLGEEPLTPWQAEQAITATQEKLEGARNDLQSRIVAAKDGAGLWELLGAEGRKKFNEYQLQVHRGGVKAPVAAAPVAPPAAPAKRYFSIDEAREQMRKVGR